MFVLPDVWHKLILLNLSFLRNNFEDVLTDYLPKICIRESDNPYAEKHTETEKTSF